MCKNNPTYKNEGWEPIHQKYQANENTSRHNPKKKQNQTINKKKRKQSCVNKTHGYKMPINDNKEDLKQESCRLPQIN